MSDRITAAMLAIGDELLSGRTKDKNIGHLAAILTAAGIDLKEVRYTYVFTSGGIGPTHDDITADAVSKAFGVPCIHDPHAMKLLADSYASRNMEFNETRQRMARMPQGSKLIANKVSVAPGFIIGNVHVMAGVPSVFETMLDVVLPTLKTGTILKSHAIHCPFGEGMIGGPLREIQKAHPDTIIGSYPKMIDGGYAVELIVRSKDEATIAAAARDIFDMLDALHSNGDPRQAPAG
jgi:molybdopterin-biosynthesis enzyme MoeA-like protein